MKQVYCAPTLPDAHLVMGLLVQAGLDARVFNENAQSVMGEIPVQQAWPQVWIMDEADLAQACELIRQFEQPRVQASPVSCPHCHEDNPSHFQTCWHCGREF